MDKRPNNLDTLADSIPNHILEEYPRFYDFLAGYYEWVNLKGNPKERIDNHLSYTDFTLQLDEYIDAMKKEYLVDTPESILLDKELFIKWSRKFNISRGSNASYKFLFRLLFNEQTTSIYLPKENVLKTSDGIWISGESLLLVTHDNKNSEQFQFQEIKQVRHIYGDLKEVATATVERVRTKFAGSYVVTELALTSIRGEFKTGFPITTELGAEEWIIPVINKASINVPGSGHQVGQRLTIQGMTNNEVTDTAINDGVFDTKITSYFTVNDITVHVNGTLISTYTYDGRTVVSADIVVGDVVLVTLPAYQGYVIVDQIDENQGVKSIDIIDLPIGKPDSYAFGSDSTNSTFDGSVDVGLTKEVNGYYSNTQGQLSSNMYLQDSYFYQNYSYVINTEQNFEAYADIVKRLLHPSGFLMFGQFNYIVTIDLLLKYSVGIDIESPLIEYTIVHKYGLGSNYNNVNKFKDGASKRLYKEGYFNSVDQNYFNGEIGYDLESSFLADRIPTYEYPNKKGWISKYNRADYHLYIEQNYTLETESGEQYFETGYLSERIV